MKDIEFKTINKMIDYINKVLRYTSSCSFDEFCKNEEKVDATVFAISQIGEILNEQV